MAEEFDWDEVLVTKDPDNKEVSVNFKAVDGQAYPGSPASELCVRIYSNETFTHITGSAHWVWLELSGVPDRYVKVRLDFDSGNGIEPPSPSPQYAEFQPGDDRTLQFALSAGVASELLNSSNYRATATIEGSSCGVSIATVEFLKDVIPPDPEPDEPVEEGGGPIDGDNPECEPGDCGTSMSALTGSTVEGNEGHGGLLIWNNVDYPLAADRQYLTTELVSVPNTTYSGNFNYFRDNLGKLIPLISDLSTKDPVNSANWPAFANWGSGTDVLCTEPGVPYAADQNANISSSTGIYPASTILSPWNLSYNASESQAWETTVATNDWANWPLYVYNGASSGGSDSWTNWFTPKTALGPNNYIVYSILAPRVGISWRTPWPFFTNGDAVQMAGNFSAIILFFGDGSIHTYENGPVSSGDWSYEYSLFRLRVFNNAWDPTGITKVKVAGSFTQNITGKSITSGENSSFRSDFGLTVTVNDKKTSFMSFKAINDNLPQTPSFDPNTVGGVGFLKDRHPLSPYGTAAKERAMQEIRLSTGLIPLAAYGTKTGYSRAQPFGRVAMAHSPSQLEANAIELAIDRAFASYTPPTYCTRIP